MHAVQMWYTAGAAQYIDSQDAERPEEPHASTTTWPTTGATQLDPGDEEREALEDWAAQQAFEAQKEEQERQHHESESEFYEDPAEVSLHGCHEDHVGAYVPTEEDEAGAAREEDEGEAAEQHEECLGRRRVTSSPTGPTDRPTSYSTPDRSDYPGRQH